MSLLVFPNTRAPSDPLAKAKADLERAILEALRGDWAAAGRIQAAQERVEAARAAASFQT